MVLIHSYESNNDTNVVCQALSARCIPFTRINTEDVISDLDIFFENEKLVAHIQFQDKQIKTSDYSFFWYKGGQFNWEKYEIKNKAQLQDDLTYFYTSEIQNLDIILHQILEGIGGVGSIFRTSLNKFIAFQKAAQLGIKVPVSEITTKTNVLKSKYNRGFLVKYLQDAYEIEVYGSRYAPNLRSLDEISFSKSSVFPTCIQEHIHKDYEVRVFYLYEDYYAVKMQLNAQTDEANIKWLSADLVDSERYLLPQSLHKQVQALLKSFSLNSASLDFLVKDGVHYLVDINPIGEFSNLSDLGQFDIANAITDKIQEKMNQALANT